MVDWVIESISADNESIKLAGLSAIRKSFFNACVRNVSSNSHFYTAN